LAGMVDYQECDHRMLLIQCDCGMKWMCTELW